MTATATAVYEEAAEPVIRDVWSRSGEKYRKRAIVLLVLNVLLFAGLGCFAFWVRTGYSFAPAMENYPQLLAETFMPRGDATLSNFVRFPIDLGDVPIHGLVVGLLMAALVSIPILIAILYRLPFALPFLFIVAFVAVMPWLSINLAAACVLATRKRFQFRFRYASALLGLLLIVVLYFYGASRQSAPLVETLKPEDRIKYIAPWVIATIASCVIMALVLTLAKLVNYRPGVVAPLLVVSFAAPVLMFEKYVGRDELYYRLLERRAKEQFYVHKGAETVDLKNWFDVLAREKWEAEPEPRPPFEAVRDLLEFRLSLELDAVNERRSVLVEQRDELLGECDWFIRYFPDSRYAANALYLKAKALDTRIDISAFREKKVIQYYDDFPTTHSQMLWRRVLANAADADIAAEARLRLAMFAAQAGQIRLALDLLDETISTYDPAIRAEATAHGVGADRGLLAVKPADANLQIPVDKIVIEARKLGSLLANNYADPRYGLRPLCGSKAGEPRQAGLLQLDPHHINYRTNLQNILNAWPDSLLADNVLLRIATLARTTDERIALTEQCLTQHPDGDARIEALYRLGRAYLDAGDTPTGRMWLEKVVAEYPTDRVWTPLAAEQLRKTAPSSNGETRS
jgi:hypothetical protein